MTALKKITAFIICIIMLCTCFVSCDQIPGFDQGNDQGNNQGNNQTGDQTGNDENNKPDGKPENKPNDNQDNEELQSEYYVANITVSYTTDDDKMKVAVEAMETETVLTAMANNLKLVSNATLNSASVSDEYIYLNGTLYHANVVKVGDKSITSLKKAAMNDTQRDKLLSKMGAGASIGIGDFTAHEMSRSEGVTIYTCANMTDSTKESFTAILASKFEAIGATVEIDSANYVLEVKNGRDQKSTLSCDLVINMGGVSYDVTMNIEIEYNYNAVTVIMTPTNADKYIISSVDDILG